MSNYTEVLARMEAPRDPENPQPDEDTPQGILRRKLNVHFGNPFRTDKKAAVVDADTPSSLHIDETAEEVAALFMDTPAPHRDAQLENAADSARPATVKDATTSSGRLTIPPLGKPPTRKRKRPLPAGKPREGEGTGAATATAAAAAESPSRSHRSGIAAASKGLKQQPDQPEQQALAALQPQQNQQPSPSIQERPAAPGSPQSVADSAQLSPRPADGTQEATSGPPAQRQRVEKVDIQPMTVPQPMQIPIPIPTPTPTPTSTTTTIQRETPASPIAAAPVQEPPLPPGWVKHFSKREQQFYFFNTNTGESSWVRPT